MTTQPCALYRLFDANNLLLYVGISDDPRARFRQHRADKDWWPEVATREIVWYPARDEAAKAEVQAIITEGPKHNRAIGVGRSRWTPSADDATALAALKRAHRGIAEAEAEYKQALADCAQADIPILRLSEELGVERKTIYRHLGRSMT